MRNGDFAHLSEDGTKLKIPSEVKPPLKSLTLAEKLCLQDTWVGDGVNEPLYPIRYWNCYSLVLDEAIKTTVHLEGWHRFLNSLVQGISHDLFKYMKVLQKEVRRQDTKYDDYIRGGNVPYVKSAIRNQHKGYHDYIIHTGKNISG